MTITIGKKTEALFSKEGSFLACSVRLATTDKAQQILEMFESALGYQGIQAPGYEPYPDPDLFSYDGILRTIESGERRLVIAEVNGTVAGGMIIDSLSPFHCEFNCMAVRQDYRGRHIGTAIVKGARELVEKSNLTINTTELVTHNLASQSAHIHQGYNRIVGFGYCHYPNVFFANHPESVLWISKLQGKLPYIAQQLRKNKGASLRKYEGLRKEIASIVAENQLSKNQTALLYQLIEERTVYVPETYKALVTSLVQQHNDILSYKVETAAADPSSEPPYPAAIEIEPKEGYGHAYIIIPSNYPADKQAIDKAVASVHSLNKRYILVRIDANSASAVEIVNHLRSSGFVFHSLLPLYRLLDEEMDKPRFRDVLTMQWVEPRIIKENPLPGETDSVIKLYGYPENLSAPIISLLRQELASI